MRIASTSHDDITDKAGTLIMFIFERLSSRFTVKKSEGSKYYSRSKMEPLPTEIYQEIVDFQKDVNRPVDISLYREFRKEAA